MESFAFGPVPIQHVVPPLAYQNIRSYEHYDKPTYSENAILQLLKRGTREHTSIQKHTPEVRKSITESFKQYPKLFEHYVKS